MNFTIVFLVSLSFVPAFGQSERQYLDEDERLLPGPVGAAYYREIEPRGKLFAVRDFYASSELAMEATCSEIDPRLVYEGFYQTYFKNGKVIEEGIYKDNQKRGLWKSYYENSQQESETLYEESKVLHLQHWDELGNKHLINGTGHYVQTSDGREDHFEILEYELAGVYTIHPVSKDSIYTIVQETAKYKSGMPELYEMIGKNLRYGEYARRGIAGKIFVQFVVQKNGTLRDVMTIKGPGGGLNEEAERVIKLAEKWTPGKVKGKPVMQKMVLVIAH